MYKMEVKQAMMGAAITHPSCEDSPDVGATICSPCPSLGIEVVVLGFGFVVVHLLILVRRAIQKL